MLKKVFFIAVCTLLTPYVAAQSRLLMLQKEQPEDFSYYHAYNWNSPIERKALFQAIKNSQHHMYKKLRTCQEETSELNIWLDAFQIGAEEVKITESERGLLDMNERPIHYVDDGDYVARWQTRDFAEKHYSIFAKKNLGQLREKYWIYCLENLDLKLFTREAEQLLEAKIKADIDREMAYP